MVYKHTQIGYLVLVILAIIAVLFSILLWQTGFNIPALLIIILILFIL